MKVRRIAARITPALALVIAVSVPGRSTGGRLVSLSSDLSDAIGTFMESVEALHAGGLLVGAQVLVGRGDEILAERQVGMIAPGDERRVDADTRFCIGSVSKPLVSSLVTGLVDAGTLSLEDPIDRWLPRFADLRLTDGARVARAPTVRELLIHRSGIFSQRHGLTPTQAGLIRDFTRSLEVSVDGISEQPLFAEPGEEYAYSGAGYCVIGRIAEVAAKQPLETLLHERLAVPLGLTRTSYFPTHGDSNVAVGARPDSGGRQPHPETPHLLGDELAFPLVGGSIYSTARDLARFARMIAARGMTSSGRLFSESAWREMTRRQQPRGPTRDYGMGWVLTIEDGRDRPAWVGHTGALAASRASLEIDLEGGAHIVVLYSITESDGRAEQAIADGIDLLKRELASATGAAA